MQARPKAAERAAERVRCAATTTPLVPRPGDLRMGHGVRGSRHLFAYVCGSVHDCCCTLEVATRSLNVLETDTQVLPVHQQASPHSGAAAKGLTNRQTRQTRTPPTPRLWKHLLLVSISPRHSLLRPHETPLQPPSIMRTNKDQLSRNQPLFGMGLSHLTPLLSGWPLVFREQR